jgi:opacity protein-like surface antigen
MTPSSLTTRLLASSALAALGLSGAASADCDRRQGQNALAGALIGGVAGGVIGNNVDGDDGYWRRGRGYGRGYRRHGRWRYYEDNDNSDEVVVGALLGAVAGGLVGAAATDCDDEPVVVGPYGVVPNDDPFRRGQVTRSGEYGFSDSYRVSQPTYREPAAPQPQYRTQPGYGNAPRYPQGQECRIVYSETRLPDGRTLREPVNVCRDNPNGEWYRAGDELYGG